MINVIGDCEAHGRRLEVSVNCDRGLRNCLLHPFTERNYILWLIYIKD